MNNNLMWYIKLLKTKGLYIKYNIYICNTCHDMKHQQLTSNIKKNV